MRVPLSGRRVRGYVVAVEAESADGLKPILTVSSPLRLFDERHLEAVRWAAQHYVAPLSTLLARTAPPNIPKPSADRVPKPLVARESPFPDVSDAAISGHRSPGWFLLGAEYGQLVELAVAVAAAGRSVLIAVPTAVEVGMMSQLVRDAAPQRLIEVRGDLSDASVTTAWSRVATRSGSIVVGTERVALWPVVDLGLAIVVDEGRRSHKARQTPTLHTRDLLRARARVEGFSFAMTGTVPTTEALSAGVRVKEPVTTGRMWSAVEIVDRAEEPPGGGLITDRVRAAIGAAVNRGQNVFVLVGRKGYAPAFRCVSCKELRRCESCGAATNQAGNCQRCGSDLGPCRSCGRRRFEPLGAGVGRLVDEVSRFQDSVGPSNSGKRVSVGTERDLVSLAAVGLGVVVDADGSIFGTNYRAREDALRLFARLGSKVDRQTGSRMILQTSQPSNPLFGALRRSDPIPFLEAK